MYGVNQHAEMLRINIRSDAVTEVEDVARPSAVARQNIGDALANDFGRLAQGRRIQIALQRNFVINIFAGRREICCPVDTQCVATGGDHVASKDRHLL